MHACLCQTQTRIETKDRSFDLKLRSSPDYETMAQPHSLIHDPVELTVDVNPAYEVTKSKPQHQIQDESEPNYEVIPTISRLQK